MLVHTSFYDFFLSWIWCPEEQFYKIFWIGNLSVLSVAAGDAEMNYPLQDTQEPGLMLCIVWVAS